MYWYSGYANPNACLSLRCLLSLYWFYLQRLTRVKEKKKKEKSIKSFNVNTVVENSLCVHFDNRENTGKSGSNLEDFFSECKSSNLVQSLSSLRSAFYLLHFGSILMNKIIEHLSAEGSSDIEAELTLSSWSRPYGVRTGARRS